MEFEFALPLCTPCPPSHSKSHPRSERQSIRLGALLSCNYNRQMRMRHLHMSICLNRSYWPRRRMTRETLRLIISRSWLISSEISFLVLTARFKTIHCRLTLAPMSTCWQTLLSPGLFLPSPNSQTHANLTTLRSMKISSLKDNIHEILIFYENNLYIYF